MFGISKVGNESVLMEARNDVVVFHPLPYGDERIINFDELKIGLPFSISIPEDLFNEVMKYRSPDWNSLPNEIISKKTDLMLSVLYMKHF